MDGSMWLGPTLAKCQVVPTFAEKGEYRIARLVNVFLN